MERKKIKAMLIAKQNEVTARIDEIRADAFKRHNTKITNQQNNEQKKEAAFNTLEEAAILELHHISQALDRIESEDFDQCSECSNLISDSQFNAIPYTEYCSRCANKHFFYFITTSAPSHTGTFQYTI